MTVNDGSHAEDSASMPIVPVQNHESEAVWRQAIEKVVPSIVSVKFTHPFSFDTGINTTSQATGFVVDAEKGYILTNRHVVGAGPFWGHIVFSNYEEVDAHPLYRDPIHDFGILRFDPSKIRHLKLVALELRPDLVDVGVEIKVIGNDGGETMSILSGFISRTDRNAPEYDGYRDFNTCYYQANAAATGGSSGSPIVNSKGQAIAIQAGGRTDDPSTNFFLPLDEPLRALGLLQKGEPVSRGDIQCKFLLKPFDECRRLGLTPAWEAHVREAHPKDTSMLVVRTVLPSGVSSGKIKEGDILLTVNGQLMTSFLLLDNIMNDNVGQAVKFILHRSGKDVEEEVVVGDLEDITPRRFLSVAGACFQDLSYQLAQTYVIPLKSVYVCETGLLELPKRNGWLIEKIATKDTPDLDTFIQIMKEIPDRARVVISYRRINELNNLRTDIVTIHRHWGSKMKIVSRNDVTGTWDFETLSEAIPPEIPVPCKAVFPKPEQVPPQALADILRSWVEVSSVLPVVVDAIKGKRAKGMGLVVDAGKGLVLVSRTIVPHRLCDVDITVAQSVAVHGRVVFVHPFHNYSVVQYDAKLVDAPIHTATLSSEPITQGQSTYFIGYNNKSKMMYTSTTVTRRHLKEISPISPPRYRTVNLEHVGIESSLGTSCPHGAMVSENGDVQGLWLSWEGEKTNYHYGMGADVILPVISRIRDGQSPDLRVLPVEFDVITLFQARVMGVSQKWIDEIEAKENMSQLFTAKRVFGDGDNRLLEADIILTLNGELITKASQLDVMYWEDVIDAEIYRNGKQISLKLQTLLADDLETKRFVSICGLWLQKPHLAVRQQVNKMYSEVYVVFRYYGSPASLYKLWPRNFLTHINDEELKSLDTVLSIVNKIPDNTYFQVRGVAYHGVPFVVTMKKNEHYFPTMEWIEDASAPDGWRKKTYEQEQILDGEGEGGVITG